MPGVKTDLRDVFKDYAREFGLRRAILRTLRYLRAGLRRLSTSMLARIFRRSLSPSLGELAKLGFGLKTDVVEILERLLPDTKWRERIPKLVEEHTKIMLELESRRSIAEERYPSEFSIRSQPSFILYCIVRESAPTTILETGVANGESTVVLLNALMRNGSGRLYSIDVEPRVGSLVSPEERRWWTLCILDRDCIRPRAALHRLMASIPMPQLFLHDSDHGYEWQTYELSEFAKLSSSEAIIAVDDADNSYATIDFCASHNLSPFTHLDGAKALCIMKWPGNSFQARGGQSRPQAVAGVK